MKVVPKRNVLASGEVLLAGKPAEVSEADAEILVRMGAAELASGEDFKKGKPGAKSRRKGASK